LQWKITWLARRTLSRPYDLTISQSDQRYGGVAAEAFASNAAVDATRGQTLAYMGGPASVFYGACCGGHTESSAEAWGGKPVAYLSGVACTYCKDSSWYRWMESIGLDRFAAALDAQGAAVGDIQSIALDSLDSSGRAHVLQVRPETVWSRRERKRTVERPGRRVFRRVSVVEEANRRNGIHATPAQTEPEVVVGVDEHTSRPQPQYATPDPRAEQRCACRGERDVVPNSHHTLCPAHAAAAAGRYPSSRYQAMLRAAPDHRSVAAAKSSRRWALVTS